MTATGLRPMADPAGRRNPLAPAPLLPPAVRPRLGWVALATALWVVGWAVPVWHRPTVPAPFSGVDWHLMLAPPSIQELAGWFADLGNMSRLAPILAVAAGTCLIGRSWRALLALGASLALVLVTVEVILKPVVDARLYPDFVPSFPSGHTATTCCLATLAVLLLGRRHGPLRLPVPRPLRVLITVLAVAIVPVVGCSMVVVGAHSVIDVLGAVPLGVTLTLVTCAGVDRLGRRRSAS